MAAQSVMKTRMIRAWRSIYSHEKQFASIAGSVSTESEIRAIAATIGSKRRGSNDQASKYNDKVE